MNKKTRRINAATKNDSQLSMLDLEKKWATPEHRALRAERRARRAAPSCFRTGA